MSFSLKNNKTLKSSFRMSSTTNLHNAFELTIAKILIEITKGLTLKAPRKPASENVYLCRLLSILANFSNLFLHTGKQCGPRSDCS